MTLKGVPHQCHGRRAQDFSGRSRINAAGLPRERWINSIHTCGCAGGKQSLIKHVNKNQLGCLPRCGKRSGKQPSPEALCRSAYSAGREVDDLAAQLFRRPLFVGQRKICRNVKLNQFRHHTLFAGRPQRHGEAFLRSHRKHLNSDRLISACPSIPLVQAS
jgi:hypothetical protein